MRITGGRVKARILASPKGLVIRPTTDQVREAIFSIIGQNLSGLKVLDLFAGTGSLGLEALSRDALYSLFIDNSQQSISLTKKNIALCEYQNSAFILKMDLKKGLLRNHFLLKETFDLVFIDPPYGKNLVPFLLDELVTKNLLASRSIVIAESGRTDRLPQAVENLNVVDSRLYGNTKIDLYTYEEKNEEKDSYLSRHF